MPFAVLLVSLALGEASAHDAADAPEEDEADEEDDEDEGDEEDDEDVEERAPRRPGRDGLGVGAGVWSLALADDRAPIPAVVVEFRRERPLGDVVALDLTSAIVVHDFAAIGAFYGWYGRTTDEDGDGRDDGLRVLKVFALWPGLVLGPLVGSNLHQSALLDVAVPVGPLNLHVGGGVHAGLLVRPTEPGLVVDLTAGVASMAALDLGRAASLDLRAYWAPALVDTLWRPEAADSYEFTAAAVFWIPEKERRRRR